MSGRNRVVAAGASVAIIWEGQTHHQRAYQQYFQ